MTQLHARVDLLEGRLPTSLVGAAEGVAQRAFAALCLTRTDGTTGLGEASPLPGYSPDSLEEALDALRQLTEQPIDADPLATPFAILAAAFSTQPVRSPSARFAVESALLDWLGRTRGEPVHRVIAGDAVPKAIPICDLVGSSDPDLWPSGVEGLVAAGATHVKFKVGVDLERELRALRAVRAEHPKLPLRVDGNRRMSVRELRKHASAFEALELELFEEPLSPEHWSAALEIPLPWALDETLRDSVERRRALGTGGIVAVVLKPTVLGGFRACLEAAEMAAGHGARYLVSHCFDGPIARAASAELALSLQTDLAAGLGVHPALSLWAPHRISAIRGREIRPHDAHGLGLFFDEDPDD